MPQLAEIEPTVHIRRQEERLWRRSGDGSNGQWLDVPLSRRDLVCLGDSCSVSQLSGLVFDNMAVGVRFDEGRATAAAAIELMMSFPAGNIDITVCVSPSYCALKLPAVGPPPGEEISRLEHYGQA